MTPVPHDLLVLVKNTAPPEAEILPLPWTYEEEDYAIAVIVPDAVDRVSARHLRDRLIEAIMEYDDAHDTFTVCMVWHERDKALAGIR